MPKPTFRLLESNLIYKGSRASFVKDRFELSRAPGKIVTRVVLRHPGAVVILPFSAPGKILLLRQFRYATRGDIVEVPAGTIEAGERPLVCAKRELEEETGFRASRWKFLTRFYPAPGISDEVMHLYRADGLKPGRKNLDHDEFLEHFEIPLERAVALARSGKIRDGKTLVALLWAARFGAK